MGVALVGSVKVALARRLCIDESRVGGLVSAFGFVMIPVVLLMGVLIDLLGKEVVLLSGSVLMACAIVVWRGRRRIGRRCSGVLLLSAGWATSINVLNVLMPSTFHGSHVYATNVGNSLFGLGAFLTPVVVAFLIRRMGFMPGLLVLAAFALAFGLLALGSTARKSRRENPLRTQLPRRRRSGAIGSCGSVLSPCSSIFLWKPRWPPGSQPTWATTA